MIIVATHETQHRRCPSPNKHGIACRSESHPPPALGVLRPASTLPSSRMILFLHGSRTSKTLIEILLCSHASDAHRRESGGDVHREFPYAALPMTSPVDFLKGAAPSVPSLFVMARQGILQTDDTLPIGLGAQ